jgi:hypothetical protein
VAVKRPDTAYTGYATLGWSRPGPDIVAPARQTRCLGSLAFSPPSGGGRRSWPKTSRRAAKHTLRPGASAVPPGPLPTNHNPPEGVTEFIHFCALWARRSPPTSLPPNGSRGRGSKESTRLRFLAFRDSYTTRWEIHFFSAFSCPVVVPVRREDWRQARLLNGKGCGASLRRPMAHA